MFNLLNKPSTLMPEAWKLYRWHLSMTTFDDTVYFDTETDNTVIQQ